jgi:hypothetical protein
MSVVAVVRTRLVCPTQPTSGGGYDLSLDSCRQVSATQPTSGGGDGLSLDTCRQVSATQPTSGSGGGARQRSHASLSHAYHLRCLHKDVFHYLDRRAASSSTSLRPEGATPVLPSTPSSRLTPARIRQQHTLQSVISNPVYNHTSMYIYDEARPDEWL